MDAAERIEFLKQSELFRGVPVSSLSEVAALFDEVRYEAGSVVFDRGDVGDAVYLVLDGTLSLEADGVSLLLRRPGECVGEFALIDEGPRSAAAVARSDVRMLRWGRAEFQEALVRDAAIARGIFRMLTQKLREDLEGRLEMQLAHERWRQDLTRAKEIQTGMLPPGEWASERVELAGYCTPAAEVGGDYYDYMPLPDGCLGLLIGDVTGHGFYSGLFVAMAKSGFHTQAPFGHQPATIMAAMRKVLDLSIGGRLLMTCCYLLFDPERRQLCYSNAGHPPVLVRRASSGRVEELAAMDPLLGALDATLQPSFAETGAPWERGDLLVLYSDGVTEARGPDGEMFGEARLRAGVSRLGDRSARDARDALLEEVARFGRGQPVGDDLTLVVVRAR